MSDVISTLSVNLEGKDVGLSTLLTKVDAATQKAADNALRLQAGYARLAATQGNTAGASSILSNALLNNAGASERAVVSLSQQLATVQKGTTVYQQFGQAASQSLTSMLGPIALVSGAISGVIAVGRSFSEAFAFKAALDASTLSINAQLKGLRDIGVTWAEAREFAEKYKLTTQETTEAIQASVGVLRVSKSSVEDVLGVLARLQVLSPEQSLQEAALAVKALASGDIVSLVGRFEVSRNVANQMKQEILGGADAVQVLSKFLDASGVSMDTLASKTTGASGAMRDLARAQEEFKIAQAQFAQGPGIAILDTATKALTATTRILTGDTQSLTQSLFASIAAHDAQQDAMLAGASAAEQAAAAELAYATAIGTNIGMTAQNTDRTKDDIVATDSHAVAVQASSQAMADETLKKLDSAEAAARLATFQTDLANLGGAVAAGLQTSANAAATLAAQYHITTGEAELLINAQARLAQAKSLAAGLAEQRAGERSPGVSGAAEATATEDRRLQALYRTLADGPKAAKAAGAARLSDQTKLNNSLLANEVAANDKYADAEKAHLDRLLDIQLEFARKSLAQQRENEVSKRQSTEDFYDRITSSELNKKTDNAATLAKIDADYQAAYQKSQELAQAGNTKLAADYLALKEKHATEQLTFEENVAKAKEDKDRSEVQRLEAIHKLRTDRQAEEEKQLLEGGDANVNARDQALADEQKKNEDAQEKIGTAAERAADRKITAAVVSGKAVADERAEVDQLGVSYARLPPARGSSVAAPAPGAAPSAELPFPAAAPATDPVASAISGLRDAIGAVEKAVNSSGDRISSAVRSSASGNFAA